ncbi:MAG: hypothetical protein KDE27_26175 [Planctomycetes bacterium]|nr:hypothetical protein [Planctomycetota bacterium]
MTKLPTSTLFAALTTVFAASTAAQSLDGTVVTDPQANTATYTFHVDGPPLGQSVLFTSLRQGIPLQFPGLYGALLVDPNWVVPLTTLSLDGAGQGTWSMQAPWQFANGLPLFTQAFAIDQQQNLAFTNFVGNVAFDVNLPFVFGMGVSSDYVGGNLDVMIENGPAGGNVTVWVNGGQKATGMLVLDGNGNGTVTTPVPGGMQRGDTVTILVNGQPVRTWQH